MNVYQHEIFPQRHQIQNHLRDQRGMNGPSLQPPYDPHAQRDLYRLNDYDRVSYLSASQQRLTCRG
ncbi:MAG: hypothetical protein AAGI37_16215 [Planctomycetota bacterium]